MTCWRSRTGDGILAIREVQPAGKKRQPVAEWVRGRGIAGGRAVHVTLPRVHAVTDAQVLALPGFLDVGAADRDPGAPGRHSPSRPDGERPRTADHAVLLRDALPGTGTALIVNARPDIAAAVAADGVQLGGGDLACR